VPIDRDRFEQLAGDALSLRKGTNAYAVVSFLAAHPDAAFTRAEIRDGANIPDGSVGPVLSRLADAGLVEHRGQYWALGPDALEW
jgi:DNA-binding IclR family transcriptional regulator